MERGKDWRMTAQIIVLSDHRKPKTEPKELSYLEFLRFCMDPFGFLEMKPEKPKQ
jgi:hypothetical protein